MENILKTLFVKNANRLLVLKTNNTYVQGFRYIFAGAAGFIVDFGLLYILTNKLGIFYLFSAALSFSVGVFVTYTLSIYWVFQQRSARSRRSEFIIFIGLGVIGLLITLVLLWVFTERLHIYYMVSKVLATIITYFWNFYARKRILFNGELEEPRKEHINTT